MIFKVAVLLLSALGSIQACCDSGCEIKLRSCKDVLRKYPDATSGIYIIDTNIGTLNVYCEMEAHGGGYTFLPRSAITPGTKLDLSDIYTESSNVLLRLQTARKQKLPPQQPFSVLEQLPKYKVIPLSVQLNSFDRYKAPLNTAMGAFLYLGFIQNDVGNHHTVQGLNSEGVDITFNYCGKNPNSYFALFPNPSNVSPNPHLVGAPWTMHTQILQSALHVPSYPDMPSDYFFFTEMHFGGCGLYQSTNQWKEVDAMAIGMR